MRNLILLLLVLLFTPMLVRAASGCDGAGNCYVYASATGTGTGANWTNACTGFTGTCAPSSMARGVTYWVAAGSYGGVTFNTPDSGTSVITIESPTTTNHGPASDWSSSFAGQALFSASTISTDYWTFNGQTRGPDWQSSYNIKFWNQTMEKSSSITLSGNLNTITFEYVEFEGTGAGFPNNNSTADKCDTNNCGVWADNGIYTTGQVTNLYVGYCYAHHTGNTQFQMNIAVSNMLTWEYNWVSYNHTGQNGVHDEAYSLYGSNVTIRYNVFQDISGSGMITTAGAGQPSLQNWAVYGNLFFWDRTYAAYNGAYALATCNNAILDFLGENMSGYVYFSNNTIAGIYNTYMDTCSGGVVGNCGASAMPVAGLSGAGGSIGSPTVIIENNLWYASGYVYGDYSSYCSVVTAATCTQDYNASYQGGVPSGDNWQTLATPAAHDYNVSGSTNPFVNFSASTIAGFQLVTPDPFANHAGVSLASPYNFDGFNQVTRGADGTWDRGAEQLGTRSAPNPPTNLTATPH